VLLQRNAPIARAEQEHFDVVFANKLLVNSGEQDVAITAESATATIATIYSQNKGSAPAVYGVAIESGTPGVKGFNEALTGIGVLGTAHIGVQGESSKPAGYGVFGRNSAGTGVWGQGALGVRGSSTSGIGVYGLTSQTDYGAVYGQHTGTGYGVVGDGVGISRAGVLGRNASGDGVRGEGQTGVYGISTSPNNFNTAVAGMNTGGGYGVIGDAQAAGLAGVLGRNGAGTGVLGYGKSGVRGESNSSGSYGVVGEGVAAAHGVSGTSAKGYGGVFKGGRAPLRLMPGTQAGAPTSGTHYKGELYLDKEAALFICTANGTPGSWKLVNVT
jgi:hypothetical protein